MSIRRKVKSALPAFFQSTGIKAFASEAAYASAKGAALAAGDAFYDTTENTLKQHDGSDWREILTANADGTSFTIDDTTSSTNKDTGALVIQGGLGVEEDINVGVDLAVGNDLTVANDATITGDLTVNGTTVTMNTDTLDVEDPNIGVNRGGNQTTANSTVSGFTVQMTDATDARIGYDSTSATKFKAGDVSGEVDLVGTSSTQTLTNKTIDGDNNTIQDLAITALKTEVAQANNFISRNGLGVPIDTKAVPSGAVVGTTDSQSLTNKTMTASTNTLSGFRHGTEVDNPTTGAHGVSGTIVGTSDSQTLTNKTINADANTITNIENGDIKAAAAIDATKIADGSVTNAEFQRINTLSSNAQDQLDGKASTTLNNLGTTSINSDLDPSASGTRDIGSSSLNWRNISGRQYNVFTTGGSNRGGLNTEETMPSGTTGNLVLRPISSSVNVGIFTPNQLSSANSSPVRIETGNTVDGDAADIVLRPGIASGSGTDGGVVIADGTEGTAGHILRSVDTAGSANWEELAAPIVTYDNTISGLVATNVKTAIDEVASLSQTIKSVNTTATLVVADDIVFADASGGIFTITLFTAVGNNGKILEIQKERTADASLNAVTIDGNAAETIGGSADTTLNTEGEIIRIISNGTNWDILNRDIPEIITAFTPTGAFSTNTTYTGQWYRRGNRAVIETLVDFTGAPNSVTFTANVPTGMTVSDASLLSTSTDEVVFGRGTAFDTTAADPRDLVIKYSSTSAVAVFFNETDTGGNPEPVNHVAATQAVPIPAASGDSYYFTYEVPIVGWKA